jgi:hypothetical protein
LVVARLVVARFVAARFVAARLAVDRLAEPDDVPRVLAAPPAASAVPAEAPRARLRAAPLDALPPPEALERDVPLRAAPERDEEDDEDALDRGAEDFLPEVPVPSEDLPLRVAMESSLWRCAGAQRKI